MEFEQISYIRVKKPPTLKQFLIRKAVGEAAKTTEDKAGTATYKGRLVPKSAKLIGEAVKGKNSQKIAKEHPEWVREYQEKH